MTEFVKNDSLDEAISRSLTEDTSDGILEQLVFNQLASDPDGVIDLINHYKKEVKCIDSEKAQYEEVKLALKEIAGRKKFVADKRAALEKMVASYLAVNNVDRQKCTDYSLVLASSKSFSLSKEYVSNLIASMNLPAWLNVEITLNKGVVDEMEMLPDGVDIVETKKFKLLKNLNDTSCESLEYFKQGMTIKEISEQRGLQWRTVYGHLYSAISKGELDLHEYIDAETLDAIRQYHVDNPAADTIMEYYKAFSGSVRYDIMALALKYLKLASN